MTYKNIHIENGNKTFHIEAVAIDGGFEAHVSLFPRVDDVIMISERFATAEQAIYEQEKLLRSVNETTEQFRARYPEEDPANWDDEEKVRRFMTQIG